MVGINALMKSTTLLNPTIETDYLFSVFFSFCLLSIYIFLGMKLNVQVFFKKIAVWEVFQTLLFAFHHKHMVREIRHMANDGHQGASSHRTDEG